MTQDNANNFDNANNANNTNNANSFNNANNANNADEWLMMLMNDADEWCLSKAGASWSVGLVFGKEAQYLLWTHPLRMSLKPLWTVLYWTKLEKSCQMLYQAFHISETSSCKYFQHELFSCHNLC